VMERKIFKYTVNDLHHAYIPRGSQVLRQDFVDDGFYKGKFVWAIVDPSNQEYVLHDYAQDQPLQIKGLKKVRLVVKEKQTILSPRPIAAGEQHGDIFVYCDPTDLEVRMWNIAVFKTGQRIDIDVDRLTYLGLNRLWIVQELGLYTFLVNE